MGKAQTFLGFALRKKSVVKGFNAVAYEKKAFLLILCSTATENAVKEAKKLAKQFRCPLIRTQLLLETLVGKENCKLVAITDRDLAKAISENTDENFQLVSED